ncbi:MAG: hypothetical protein ACRYFR_04765 [Janthinobacterium lividum]
METHAPYGVALLAVPPAPQVLDLAALHARLLPLARDAGHALLTLECHYNGAASYEASASGGPSSFRRYVSWLEPGDGDRAEHFERVLTQRLQEQAGYLAAVNAQLATPSCTHPALAGPAA